MKVLHIGYYRDGSGWANMTQNHILALDSVGVNIVPRNFNLGRNEYVHPRVLELEDNDLDGVTHVIQELHPHHLVHDSSFKKNIGFYLGDLVHLNIPNWERRLELMDSIWTLNYASENSIKDIAKHVETIGHAVDTAIYERTYDRVNLGRHSGRFIFYVVGELNSRKNIKDAIRAFHTEFDRNEPVSLLIKVNKAGMSANQIMDIVTAESNKIKQALKIYPNPEYYHQEIIIAGDISHEELMNLHETCDCYVNTSHGETWSIPMFDAYAMGNQIVCQEDYYDYITEGNGVFTYMEVNDDVFGYNDTFFELGNSRNEWYNPYMKSLRFAMRKAYETKYMKIRRNVDNYSFESIGNKMLEGLNA